MNVGFDQLLGVLAALERPALRIRPRQCSRLRHRKTSCSLCADVCPAGAISWGPTTLEVAAQQCSGCGQCAAVCPTGALESRTPTGPELVGRIRDAAKQTPAVALACRAYVAAHPEVAGTCVRVDCLGRIDESVLVGAVAWGAKQVLLIDGACEQCRNGGIHAALARIVERSNLLLGAFGASGEISVVGQVPGELISHGRAPVSAVSRRDLFGMMVGRGRQTTAAGVAAVAVEVQEPTTAASLRVGELPTFVPTKRQLLLSALARLGQPTAADLPGGDGFWADVRFTEKCTGCRMCAVFCPTSALSKAEDDGKPAVHFTASKCTGCFLCRDICLWKAVQTSAAIDAERALSGSAVPLSNPNGPDADHRPY